MKYIVNLTEILSRDVIIEANSVEEAEGAVEQLYYKQKIVLDYNDFEDGSQTIKCKRICTESDNLDDYDFVLK